MTITSQYTYEDMDKIRIHKHAKALIIFVLSAQSALSQAGLSPALEEIIVTAERRSENVQEVPISISTVSAEQIENQKIMNIFDISSQVPNLQVIAPNGNSIPMFSIRGVSALEYSATQSSPIALYVDEVYKGLPAFTSLQVFDVERVEVLRGPQGTLYGKNTTGGAINFHTKTADPGEGVSGYITGGYGNYDRREVSGAVNIPLVDDVFGARVAFTSTRVDGVVDNKYPDQDDQSSIDDWAGRVSLRWTPSETLDVVLRATSSKSAPKGYDVYANNIAPGGIAFTGYNREGLSYADSESDHPGSQDIRNRSGSLNVRWDVSDNLSLASVTSYDDGKWFTDADDDGSPYDLLRIIQDSDAKAWTQDLRLASNSAGSFNWLIGAFFYTDKVESTFDSRFFYSFASEEYSCFDDFFTGCIYSNEMRQDRDTYAAYAQGNWELNEKVSLTAGIRYTKDKIKLPYYRANLGFLDVATGVEYLDVEPIFTEPPIDNADESNVSGKLGIEYQMNDLTMIYASVSNGFRGGAFPGQIQFGAQEITYAKPEDVYALETGFKNESENNTVRTNAALFYYEYRNQQYTDIQDTLGQIFTNAKKSWVYGGELELIARPVAELELHAGVGYTKAEYEDASLKGVDLNGNTLLISPEWTISGGIDWRIASNSLGDLSLHTNSSYTSKTYFDAFNTNRISQGGYVLHDAQLSFETAAVPVRISAWIKNITDEKYGTYKLSLQEFLNMDYMHRGRPREYGVEISYTF